MELVGVDAAPPFLAVTFPMNRKEPRGVWKAPPCGWKWFIPSRPFSKPKRRLCGPLAQPRLML